MPYIVLADLTARYGADELIKLADRDNDNAPDSLVVGAAINDAEATINMYLATRYAVPLAAPVPSEIVRIACALTRYHLYDDSPTDKVRADYKDALRLLESIADGQASIVISTPTSAGADTPNYYAGSSQFGASQMTGY